MDDWGHPSEVRYDLIKWWREVPAETPAWREAFDRAMRRSRETGMRATVRSTPIDMSTVAEMRIDHVWQVGLIQRIMEVTGR